MEKTKAFRQCLHPSPLGFALGILMIAFSLGLWVWILAGLSPARGENGYSLISSTVFFTDWKEPSNIAFSSAVRSSW